MTTKRALPPAAGRLRSGRQATSNISGRGRSGVEAPRRLERRHEGEIGASYRSCRSSASRPTGRRRADKTNDGSGIRAGVGRQIDRYGEHRVALRDRHAPKRGGGTLECRLAEVVAPHADEPHDRRPERYTLDRRTEVRAFGALIHAGAPANRVRRRDRAASGWRDPRVFQQLDASTEAGIVRVERQPFAIAGDCAGIGWPTECAVGGAAQAPARKRRTRRRSICGRGQFALVQCGQRPRRATYRRNTRRGSRRRWRAATGRGRPEATSRPARSP